MKLKPLVSLLAAIFVAPTVLASTSGIVISQVYGGGGSTSASAIYKTDFVELFNAGSTTQSLAGWSLQYASATGAFSNKLALSGSLEPGRYLLISVGSTSTGGADLPTADLSTTSFSMAAAAGKLALVSDNVALGTVTNGSFPSTVVDLVGYGTTASAYEGTASTAATAVSTGAARNNYGCTDTDDNGADFTVGTPSARNSATAANVCGSTTPVNQAIVPSCPAASAVAGTASVLSVTATDADSVVNSATIVDSWPSGFTQGTFTAADAEGGVATQQINVDTSVAVGSYTLKLQWANDEAQTASCSLSVTVSGVVKIPAIQGSGSTSPLVGSSVTTTGIVTKLISTGFYLQDPDGDGDDSTSDGVFVYTSSAPTVSVGDEVRVSATVAEYVMSSSSSDSVAHPLTELTSPTVTKLGSGKESLISPVEVDMSTLEADGLERYEGMLVKLTGPFTVQGNAYLGSYGILNLAVGEDRLNQVTNVLRPGTDEAVALNAENNRRTLILDDSSSTTNPNPTPYLASDNTVRAGDRVDTIVGVIDYGLTGSSSGPAAYKIHPKETPVITRVNARTTAPDAAGGNYSVASANVLNYFTTFTNGTSVSDQSSTSQGCTSGSSTSKGNCRGADNLAEFQRQHAKIVANLSALNADVIGLMEIQNAGNTAVQYLVDGINAKLGAGTYAVVPTPAEGTGTDAIRVAMIYKPGKLTLQGASLSDADSVNNRPPFAQGFLAPNGQSFAVVVNHLKSKGSCSTSSSTAAGDKDTGDLQGCWNLTRVNQATRLKSWIETVKTTANTANVIMIGDFNSYAKEDPIITLTEDGGVVDQVARFDEAEYSYVYNGLAGRLDHGLATSSMTDKIVSAKSWHINSDEPEVIDYNTDGKSVDYYEGTPYRSSDHDPLLIGLSLVKDLAGTSGRDTIVGTAGDDVITGGAGADTLTGGKGRDQFVYNALTDAGDTITDFTVGEDTLVFTKLLSSQGISVADPLASGHVTCTSSTAGAIISTDVDGSAGATKARAIVTLKGVSCSAITASSFKF